MSTNTYIQSVCSALKSDIIFRSLVLRRCGIGLLMDMSASLAVGLARRHPAVAMYRLTFHRLPGILRLVAAVDHDHTMIVVRGRDAPHGRPLIL